MLRRQLAGAIEGRSKLFTSHRTHAETKSTQSEGPPGKRARAAAVTHRHVGHSSAARS